jgi:oxygen-independent coproporphyrinogen-3 oxidase
MKPLYLYIHIPFCRKKCAYCDFYSIAPEAGADACLNALHASLAYHAERIAGNYRLETLYLGGGTPNLLPADRLRGLIDAVVKYFHIAEDPEISIEINPEFAQEPAQLRALKNAGFNRLSIGVQSLNDAELQLLGRLHSRDTALQCLEQARKLFDNLSADLIYAIPGQTIAGLRENLEALLHFAPEHLSAYALSCEEGTTLAKRVKKGTVTLQDEEDERRAFLFLHAALERRSYRHYEISSYAVTGHESRHNSAYWSGEDYLGIGPSAHSKLGDRRYSYRADLKAFLKDPREFHDCGKVRAGDRLITGLRTRRGLWKGELPSELWSRVRDYAMRRPGLFRSGKENISCTPQGWLILDSILLDLI